MPHPNTVAAASTGVGASLVMWVASRAGVDLPVWAGGLIATGAASVFLFVGRNGIVGVWNGILHGFGRGPK